MRIAVLEDNEADAALLKRNLERFFREREYQESLVFDVYTNAFPFLENYKGKADLVFMDIGLPLMDGMSAAQKLRERDANVPLVFTTSMAQFAVKGYDVAANGFLVKPVTFSDLFLCMRRIMQVMETQKGKPLAVSSREGVHMLSSGDVFYIEVIHHMLTYHTRLGDYSGTGNLGEISDALSTDFFLCNRSFLVNFRYIKSVAGNEIEMGNGDRIPLSRARKKMFLDAFNHWLGRM